MTAMIRTEGLTKRFGRLTVVDRVDLEVPEGEIFGFLGPNGSGKTTTIRMVLGLVGPTAGRVEVLGRPMPDSRVLSDVGVLVEGPGFYPNLSGRRNLTIFDAAGPRAPCATRRRRIGDALDQVGLGGIDRRPVKAYSLGMRQRLGLAAALVRRPRLLVLDEPTNGLDPQGMREVRSLLAELSAGGTTVFLSSHLLGEVEAICARAAMMSNGRLVAHDLVERLMAPTGHVLLDTPDVEAAARVIMRAGPLQVERRDGRLRVELDTWAPERLNRELVTAGVRVRELVVERRSLEDAYLVLTGESGDLRG